MALTNGDLQAIAKLVNDNSNLILSELDRVEQRVYRHFEEVRQDMQLIREEIHTTKKLLKIKV